MIDEDSDVDFGTILDEEVGKIGEHKMNKDCQDIIHNHGKRIRSLEDHVSTFLAQGRLFKWFVGVGISIILVSLPIMINIFTDQMRESSKSISQSLDNFATEISKGVEQRGRMDERIQNVEKHLDKLDSRLSNH